MAHRSGLENAAAQLMVLLYVVYVVVPAQLPRSASTPGVECRPSRERKRLMISTRLPRAMCQQTCRLVMTEQSVHSSMNR